MNLTNFLKHINIVTESKKKKKKKKDVLWGYGWYGRIFPEYEDKENENNDNVPPEDGGQPQESSAGKPTVAISTPTIATGTAGTDGGALSSNGGSASEGSSASGGSGGSSAGGSSGGGSS